MPTSFEELLRNRAIRNYLSHFNQRSWHTVVKYTLLFGIQNLTQRGEDLSKITLKRLEQLLVSQRLENEVTATLPSLADRLGNVMENVRELREELGMESPSAAEQPKKASAVPAVPSKKPKPQKKAPAARVGVAVHAKPRHVWRNGDKAKFRHPVPPLNRPAGPMSEWTVPGQDNMLLTAEETMEWDADAIPVRPVVDDVTSDVYPAWYGHETHVPSKSTRKTRPQVVQTKKSAAQSARVSEKEKGDETPVFVDDLVTTAYLNVPSSGYGKEKRKGEEEEKKEEKKMSFRQRMEEEKKKKKEEEEEQKVKQSQKPKKKKKSTRTADVVSEFLDQPFMSSFLPPKTKISSQSQSHTYQDPPAPQAVDTANMEEKGGGVVWEISMKPASKNVKKVEEETMSEISVSESESSTWSDALADALMGETLPIGTESPTSSDESLKNEQEPGTKMPVALSPESLEEHSLVSDLDL